MARRPAPAETIVNPGVAGYEDNPAFAGPTRHGDPEAARRSSQEAGVETAVPDQVHLPGIADDRQAAAAVLKESWDEAGFEVTLDA